MISFLASLSKPWQALLSCAFISVLPNLLLFAIPSSLLQRKRLNALNFQNILLFFAVGGLLGDVFLHILPHLFFPHSHGDDGHGSHGHDHHEQLQDAEDQDLIDDDNHQHVLHREDHVDSHSFDGHHDHLDSHENCTHDHDNHHHDDLSKEHSHSDHSHFDERLLYLGLQILLGFLIFYLLERITSIIKKSRATARKSSANAIFVGEHSNADASCSSSSNSSTNSSSRSSSNSSNNSTTKRRSSSVSNKSKSANLSVAEAAAVSERRNTTASPPTAAATVAPVGIASRISSIGWLNLLADGLHNFTDGLAIGASAQPIATLLAVLFHEIPHEIGDMVILMECGLTKFEAIKAQFATAVFALLGTIVGICYQQNEPVRNSLNAITSGGFIYIACVTIVPKLLDGASSSSHSHHDHGHSPSDNNSRDDGSDDKQSDCSQDVSTMWIQLALESLAFMLGVSIMILVLHLE